MIVIDARSPTVSATGLRDLLGSAQAPIILDVRLQEDWEMLRIPGSISSCVFDVDFSHRMLALVKDYTQPIVVCGADAGSLEGRMAADKLRNAGFQDVTEFRDGLLGWVAAALPTEGTGPASEVGAPADGMYAVDLQESRIHWFGKNLLNGHDGLVPLKSGALSVKDGRLNGGSFSIDMRSISCLDLAGTPLHDVLIRHLMDYDFFEVEKYPEARFTIKSASQIAGATAGAPNLTISGILAMKDVTSPLEFQATTGIAPDGRLAAQATLALDRTRWHVLYGSGKWFRKLGGHLVNDMIEIQLRIVTKPG